MAVAGALGWLCLTSQPRAQEAGEGADTAGAGKVLWKFAPAGSSFTQVLARDGSVFALDRSGYVYALDAATGKQLWRTEGKRSFSYGHGLALSPNKKFPAIIVGCDTGLFALHHETGKQLWQTEIELGVNGPTCTTDVVAAGCADGKLYACDLADGNIVWEHDFLEDAPDDPKGFDGNAARFEGRPARPSAASSDGSMIAFSVFDQCRTVAVDAKTGKRLWAFDTKGWMSGRPTFDARNVFVGSQDRHFYAIDRQMGKLAWKVKTGSRVSGGGAVDDRFVYFGSCDARLYAVDNAVGGIRWQYETEHEKGRGAPIYSRPLLLGDTVYLAAMDGLVYAVAQKTGELRWKMRPVPDSDLNSDLAIDGKRLFMSTRKSKPKKGESAVVAVEAR